MFRTLTFLTLLLSTTAIHGQEVLTVPAPFATIQAAVDAAEDGDTIEISAGLYAPFAIDGLVNVSMVGKGKVAVVGGGSADALVTIDNSIAITLKNIDVVDGTGDGIVVTNGTNIRIEQSSIDELGGDAIRYLASSGGAVEKASIEDVGGSGIVIGTLGMAANGVLLRSNKIMRVGVDGIVVFGAGNTAEKNKIVEAGDTGMRVSGQSNTLVKNKVTNATTAAYVLTLSTEAELDRNTSSGALIGLVVEGLQNNIERQKIVKTDNFGATIDGLLNSMSRAKVTKPANDGILINGNNHTLTRNKVVAAGDDGFVCDGTQCNLIENVAIKSAEDGFDITSNDSLMFKNRASKSGDSGFEVSGEGNTFDSNKANGSASFDLQEIVSDENSNVFINNKFKTVNKFSI